MLKGHSRKSLYYCIRKKKFDELNAIRLAKKWGQYTYSCPSCGYWHLTKKEQKINGSKGQDALEG